MTDNPHAPPTSQSAKPVAWRYHYPGAEKLAEAHCKPLEQTKDVQAGRKPMKNKGSIFTRCSTKPLI